MIPMFIEVFEHFVWNPHIFNVATDVKTKFEMVVIHAIRSFLKALNDAWNVLVTLLTDVLKLFIFGCGRDTFCNFNKGFSHLLKLHFKYLI